LAAYLFDTYPDELVRVSAPATTPPSYRIARMVVPMLTSPPPDPRGTQLTEEERRRAGRRTKTRSDGLLFALIGSLLRNLPEAGFARSAEDGFFRPKTILQIPINCTFLPKSEIFYTAE